MAMPPRSLNRRGASQKWLVVPFAITALVLIVDASVQAHNPKPEKALSALAWVDKVIPELAASTAEGRELGQLVTSRPQMSGQTADGQLAAIAREAAATYKSVVDSSPPGEATTAAGLLEAALSARASGTAEIATTAQALLHGAKQPDMLSRLETAVADFQVGDSAYRLFAAAVPALGVHVPPSQWAVPASAWAPESLANFESRLMAASGTASQRLLAIDAVTTNPPALSLESGIEVLSPASSLSVTVVVANTSRSAESGISVVASISPAKGAVSQQVSGSLDLAAGQAYALTLRGLEMLPSTATTLTVRAQGPGGAAAAASRTLRVEVPGPNFTGVSTSSTTTTTAPTTTRT
jgi:hypothetical protein